jgi:hypothetical protein
MSRKASGKLAPQSAIEMWREWQAKKEKLNLLAIALRHGYTPTVGILHTNGSNVLALQPEVRP